MKRLISTLSNSLINLIINLNENNKLFNVLPLIVLGNIFDEVNLMISLDFSISKGGGDDPPQASSIKLDHICSHVSPSADVGPY